MPRIEVGHDGRRVLVPVFILRADPATDLTGLSVMALLDTGATTSGIAPRVSEVLQLKPRGKRPLVSAHGLGQAERYAFRVGLAVDDASFPFVFEDVLGFEVAADASFEALLGVDVLSQCTIHLMRRRCVLTAGSATAN